MFDGNVYAKAANVVRRNGYPIVSIKMDPKDMQLHLTVNGQRHKALDQLQLWAGSLVGAWAFLRDEVRANMSAPVNNRIEAGEYDGE